MGQILVQRSLQNTRQIWSNPEEAVKFTLFLQRSWTIYIIFITTPLCKSQKNNINSIIVHPSCQWNNDCILIICIVMSSHKWHKPHKWWTSWSIKSSTIHGLCHNLTWIIFFAQPKSSYNSSFFYFSNFCSAPKITFTAVLRGKIVWSLSLCSFSLF